MPNGEEEDGMPPNSTQNLNAKLSLTVDTEEHPAVPVQSFAQPPIQSSAPPVRIVPGASVLHDGVGGYHLSNV